MREKLRGARPPTLTIDALITGCALLLLLDEGGGKNKRYGVKANGHTRSLPGGSRASTERPSFGFNR